MDSQDELGQGLLRAIRELTADHKDPVILIGSGDLSGWIRGWSYAPYRRDATLPEGITVERSQVRSQNGYVFDVSGTPVYSTEINLGGVWVLAREVFIALKVTKPSENGIPVRLTFTPDSENPFEGAMHIRWNQGVETDGSPIFLLNQPEPTAPPEQPT